MPLCPSKSAVTCLTHQIQGVEWVSDPNKKAMWLCQITKIDLYVSMFYVPQELLVKFKYIINPDT